MPKFTLKALRPTKWAWRKSGVAKKAVAISERAEEDFSAEEKRFLDGLANHREAFSAAAVVARAKKHQ